MPPLPPENTGNAPENNGTESVDELYAQSEGRESFLDDIRHGRVSVRTVDDIRTITRYAVRHRVDHAELLSAIELGQQANRRDDEAERTRTAIGSIPPEIAMIQPGISLPTEMYTNYNRASDSIVRWTSEADLLISEDNPSVSRRARRHNAHLQERTAAQLNPIQALHGNRFNPLNRVRDEENANVECLHCLRFIRGRNNLLITGHDYTYYVCSNCITMYSNCGECDRRVLTDSTYARREDTAICGDCYRSNDYELCNDCNFATLRDDMSMVHNDLFCSYCAPEEEEEDDHSENIYRNPNIESRKFQSKEEGSIIQSPRGFAVEIECFAPDGDAISKVNSLIAPEIGATNDGSLGGHPMGIGIEYQTPVLKGAKGEKFLVDLCEVLNKEKYEVNNTCGLHVHLSGDDLMLNSSSRKAYHAVKMLWLFHLVFEDVITSFLPHPRRKNHYCRKMGADYHLSEILNAQSLEHLEQIWYRSNNAREISSMKLNRYTNSRYTGINLHSLLSHKHLEIRYHSGTLNVRKMLYWIDFHMAIMEMATKSVNEYTQLLECFEESDLGEKTAKMFSFLALKPETVDYLLARQKKFTKKDLLEEAITLN